MVFVTFGENLPSPPPTNILEQKMFTGTVSPVLVFNRLKNENLSVQIGNGDNKDNNGDVDVINTTL